MYRFVPSAYRRRRTKLSKFFGALCRRAKKTESQALKAKGGWVIDFCTDKKFLAELALVEQGENIVENNFGKTKLIKLGIIRN
jgi:hypothetical protein